MAVWCTTLPAAMHHLCGRSAPFRRWRCTIIRGQVALLGRHMHFAISRYSEDGIKILYHLIKTRTDLKTSTMFTSQYAPSEWGKYLSDEEGCYSKLDGIRRRLTTGYTVHIEKL